MIQPDLRLNETRMTNMALHQNSCFSVCGVLTFCDETAWKIIVVVTHTYRSNSSTFFTAMFDLSFKCVMS